MSQEKGKKTRSLIHNKCPPGYVKRKGFTRKNTGKYVKAICIRSTSPYPVSSKKATRSKKAKARCPPGKIPRRSFTRRIGSKVVHVSSSCVSPTKEQKVAKTLYTGRPAQTIGPLRKGELGRFGYGYKLPESVRHSSLRKAIKEMGALNLYRKLDAVAKLTVTTSPKASATFAADRDWIRRHWVLKAQ